MVVYDPGKLIQVDEFKFHVRDDGTGLPVLLLHGFPDTGDLWRFQVPALVEAGYRTIVPDLRGRGQSDKPQAVSDYRMSKLLQDIAGILDVLGVEQVHLVGHDFGAALAWVFAAAFPSRVRTLTVLSVGSPGTGELPTLEALQKSWYRILFAFPGDVGERLVQQHNWYLMRELMKSSPDAERYIEDLSEENALTAGLNWYRANLPVEKLVSPSTRPFRVEAPTMGIWSSEDVALTEEAMRNSQSVVQNTWRFERLEGVGHWIPLEDPVTLNRLLLDFFASVM